MKEQNEREVLAGLLTRVRRRIFIQSTVSWLVQLGTFVLPLAAIGIAINQRWGNGRTGMLVAAAALAVLAVASLVLAGRGLGKRVQAAFTLDQQAHLKDRISSAWEFLKEPSLDEARHVQIRDAIQRASELDCPQVLRMKWPRIAPVLPVAVLLLILSFLVPPISQTAQANVPKDSVRDAQLQQLAELKQEITASHQQLPEELQEVVKNLEEMRRRFEQGEIGEREVMLELGRLDESLRSKLNQLGVENLESEMNQMVPHLSANAATLAAAEAMKEKQFDKAAEEFKNLADKVANNKLNAEERKKLAAHLGTAASKLGKKSSSDSFSGDLAQASEALEKSDSEGFKSACKSMGSKLNKVGQCQSMKSVCIKLGLCKSCLGQCNSQQQGFCLSPKSTSNKKGGLKAGTGASGDPFGDASRLADSYKKMLQIAGQSGQGPVESETEITEGQMSHSQLDAKQVHAAYAAVAEEVIEREDIPLSQRYHVKRYFQAIRPQE